MRVLLLGPPGSGKTMTGRLYGAVSMVPVHSTDALIASHSWQEQIEAITQWIDEPGPWVIEGVSAVWALRAWLELHPEGAPADYVVWLSTPKVERSARATALGKGAARVFDEVRAALEARGVGVNIR